VITYFNIFFWENQSKGEKIMDKFLEIVFESQIINTAEKGDKASEYFKPFFDKLQGIVSEKVFEELMDSFSECEVNTINYYAVEGMKLAIGIMNGSYVPQI
jgi:hypothetical protein